MRTENVSYIGQWSLKLFHVECETYVDIAFQRAYSSGQRFPHKSNHKENDQQETLQVAQVHGGLLNSVWSAFFKQRTSRLWKTNINSCLVKHCFVKISHFGTLRNTRAHKWIKNCRVEWKRLWPSRYIVAKHSWQLISVNMTECRTLPWKEFSLISLVKHTPQNNFMTFWVDRNSNKLLCYRSFLSVSFKCDCWTIE